MIYDEFVKDDEWNRLNALRHMHDLTYRERDAINASLDAREQLIRKRVKGETASLVTEYNANAPAIQEAQLKGEGALKRLYAKLRGRIK